MTTEEAILTLREAVDEDFGAGIEIITKDGCEAVEMGIEALEERGCLVHWMTKFCRHIDMGDKPYTDAEAYEFWKKKMRQQFGWEVDE